MIMPGNINKMDPDAIMNDSFYNGRPNFKQLQFDPLITGYAVIIWDTLPKWVEAAYPQFKAFTQKNFKGLTGIEDMVLETVDYNYGFNNNAYAVAAGTTKNNTEFTLTHQEYSGSPVKNMYAHWVSCISDPETGIATYPRKYNVDYGARNHTGSLMYIMLRPDVNNIGAEGKNIEFAAYFTNVFPKKIPLSHLEYTQGTRDQVTIEIPFSGTMHISSKVDDYAKELLNTSYSFVTSGMFDPKKEYEGYKANNITIFDMETGNPN